jgi:hypothetical protein
MPVVCQGCRNGAERAMSCRLSDAQHADVAKFDLRYDGAEPAVCAVGSGDGATVAT